MAFDYDVKIEGLQLKQTSDLETMLVEEEQQQPLPSQDLLSIVEPEVVRIQPDPTALLAWVDDVSLASHEERALVESNLIARMHDRLADDAMAALAQDHAAELDDDRDESGVIADFVPNTQHDHVVDVPDPAADYFVPSANRPFLDEDSLFNGGGDGGGGPPPPSDEPHGDGDGEDDTPAGSRSSTPAADARGAKPERKPDAATENVPAAKPGKVSREKDRK